MKSASRQMLMLHGWGFHGGVWDSTRTALNGGFEVETPDLPGYGDAAVPAAPTLAGMAASLLARPCDAASVWSGWSLGGLVAIQAAASAPERVGALILVAATPCFVSGADWPHGMAASVFERFAADLDADAQTTLSRFVMLAAKGGGERAVARALRAVVASRARPAVSTLRAGLRILATADLRAALAAVRCPTLLVLGNADALIPVEAAPDVAALNPNLRVRIIEGAGHAPFLSHRPQFLAIVREFLL